jgi:hypothetical protein
MKWIASLAASLWLAACPVPGLAQAPPPSEQVVAPYEELLSVLMAALEGEFQVEQRALEFSQQAVASHPSLQQAEATRPGLAIAIAEAAKPVFTRFSAYATAVYRPRFLDALKATISEDEAVSALEFYGSDIGRKLQQRTAEALNGGEPLNEAAAIAAFPQRALGDGLAAGDGLAHHTELVRAMLSPEEERALEDSLRRFPVLVKLHRFAAAVLPIRIAMVNEPLSADDYAALGRAAEQGIAAYQASRR